MKAQKWFICFIALLFINVQLIAQDELIPIREGMADVNDIEIYYAVYGEGEALILLHGALGNSDYWSNQIPAFAAEYQVIVMDSRGHGRSTVSEQPIDYALMASDVLGLMDYLGIERANILGWSDGGITSLYMLIHHAERLNKVVVYGSNYNTSGVRADIGENEWVNAYIEQAFNDYAILSPNPDGLVAFLENINRMWTFEPNYSSEELGAITTPVLILGGRDDEAVYIEHIVELAFLIPTAQLTVMPNTGHFALWDEVENFNAIVLTYLAEGAASE